jgi:cysteine desulfurase
MEANRIFIQHPCRGCAPAPLPMRKRGKQDSRFTISLAMIYLDHNATTPLHPRAREAMLPWLGGGSHGNPSSVHRFGQAAREAVEGAREQVAALLGVRPLEVVFTASGTEANNAVMFHAARKAGGMGHLVISAIEHPSIREAAARLAETGLEVTRVSPRGDGVVPAEEVIRALRPDTRLVALMLANNELGTLQPVAEVAAACRERGIPVLCDAVQAVGKIPVDAPSLGADYLVLGAHKFHGPLGAAAVWTRQELSPYLVGGSQERRRRAGTENVPAIVGLGAAAAAAREEMPRRAAHLAALRDRFEAALPARVPGAILHCQASPRLPNTSHVAFEGVEGESLLIRLDLAGFAVSTGSACSSGSVEPSKTLLAAGISREEALSSLRVSFGIGNTLEEVDAFLDALAREVAGLRRAVA